MIAQPTLASSGRTPEQLASARLLRRVMRQWWLVAVCAVLAGVAGYLASKARTPMYQASSDVQVQQTDLVALFLSNQLVGGNQDPADQAARTAALVNLPRVRERASGLLDGRISPDALKAQVGVSQDASSGFVTVTATAADPRLAARYADAMVRGFIATRRDATRQQLSQAEDQVRTQYEGLSASAKASETGRVLADRLRQVGIVGALADGGVDVVQTARVPSAPSSPNARRDALLALIIGGLIGLGAAVLRARLDDRVRAVDELQELWPIPVVGLVPESRSLTARGDGVPEAVALEAFSLARTNLRFLRVEGELRTIVVTSAIDGEGKSTVAWNLAVAAASAGSRVLLIESDLRRPVLAERLNLAVRVGFSEVLAGMTNPMAAVIRVDLPEGRVPARIDVLPAGTVPPNPIALLDQNTVGPILQRFRAAYDLVLIDTPPATVVADALVVLSRADAVLVVSRLDRVTGAAFARLREQIVAADKPVLGAVINGGLGLKGYGSSPYYTKDTPTGGDRRPGVRPRARAVRPRAQRPPVKL